MKHLILVCFLSGLVIIGIPSCLISQEITRKPLLKHILGEVDDLTADQIYKRFINSEFQISTLMDNQDGSFEFYMSMPEIDGSQSPNFKKIIAIHNVYDIQKHSAAVIAFKPEGAIAFIAVNGRALHVNTEGKSGIDEDFKWFFAADENLYRELTNPSHLSVGEQWRSHLDLPRFFNAIPYQNRPRHHWQKTLLKLVTQSSDSNAYGWIAFRTPNDQRRYGTILSEVFLRNRLQTPTVFRNLITQDNSDIRLKNRNLEILANSATSLTNQVVAQLEAELGQSFHDKYGSCYEQVVEQLMCQLDLSLLDDDSIEKPIQFSLANQNEISSDIIQHLNMISWDIAQKNWVAVNIFLKRLTGELDVASLAIEQRLNQDANGLVTDDPGILWMNFSKVVKPSLANKLTKDYLKLVLSADEIELECRIQFCAVVGDLGVPAWAYDYDIYCNRQSRLLKAILYSRWQWPALEGEMALCQQLINMPWASEIEKEAAIDCLIRWGEFSNIPEEQLNDWFQKKLASSEAHRHHTWKALTRTQPGRAFLKTQQDVLTEHPEIQQRIADMICYRVDATQDMKRFDFITEEECAELLEIYQPIALKAAVSVK